MAETTAISWTDATWSPWEGCTKVSPGCDHCYAAGMNQWLRKAENWGAGAPRREYSDAHWQKPLKWNAAAAAKGERLRVFPSVCDPFDNEVDPARRARFFALIGLTPHLDWLLLTKRIGNAAKMLEAPGMPKTLPPNIRVGATMVNQEEWDRDAGKLLALGCRNFVSLEPLLGPIDMTAHLWGRHEDIDVICQNCPRDADCECGSNTRAALKLPALDWVIVGGESGPHARPMSIQWIRQLRDQCNAAGVPLHFKQWGEWAPAGLRRAEEPGRFAFGDYEHEPATFVQTDRYPRAFTKFGARCVLERVGKKAAGRLLDGVEHNGVPS